MQACKRVVCCVATQTTLHSKVIHLNVEYEWCDRAVKYNIGHVEVCHVVSDHLFSFTNFSLVVPNGKRWWVLLHLCIWAKTPMWVRGHWSAHEWTFHSIFSKLLLNRIFIHLFFLLLSLGKMSSSPIWLWQYESIRKRDLDSIYWQRDFI